LGLAVAGLTVLAQTTPTATQAPTAPAVKPAATTTPPASTAQLPAPSVKLAATYDKTAVAVHVNDEPIYEHALQRALERVPSNRRDEFRPRLIHELVDNLLIDQSLRSANYKADPAEVEKRVADMKAELKKIGKDFDKMLAELKVDENELRQHIAADLRWFAYANAQATDKALQDLFSSNKEMFDETTVRARHILLSSAPGKDEKAQTEKLAKVRKDIEKDVEAALAKLPADSDKLAREKARATLVVDAFGKYARENSECPSKASGGDVGWFPKVGTMVQPFADAAYALQPYQMSDVVKTPFGYHLILVTERKPGKDVKFADVKEVVKVVYFDRLREGLATALRPKAKIVIHPAPK